MPGTAWIHQDMMFPTPSDHMIRMCYASHVQHTTTGFQSVPSSSVRGNRVDFTFHLIIGLHISYRFRSEHMPMVPEYSSPFPSVTQWFLPCQLLGNLSTDASGT